MTRRGSIGDRWLLEHRGVIHAGVVHGHAGRVYICRGVVYAVRGIQCTGNKWRTVGTERRIDQVSSGFWRSPPRAGGVIVNKERRRTYDGQDGECPGPPKTIEGSTRAKIFDYANRNEKERINLVLSSLPVVVQKPRPAHVASRPDFSITPKGQEQAHKQKQSWPEIAQRSELRIQKGHQHEESDSNQCPSSDVVIELRRSLVGIHRCEGDRTCNRDQVLARNLGHQNIVCTSVQSRKANPKNQNITYRTHTHPSIEQNDLQLSPCRNYRAD